MTTILHPSKRVKSLKPDTSALIGCINALPGPSLDEIAAFQEQLWNDAFNASAEACYKHWYAIVFLFYDMVTFQGEREDEFLLRPSLFDKAQEAPGKIFASHS